MKSRCKSVQNKVALNRNICAPSLEAATDLENRNQTIMIFTKELFASV